MQKTNKKMFPVLVSTIAFVALADNPGVGQRLEKEEVQPLVRESGS